MYALDFWQKSGDGYNTVRMPFARLCHPITDRHFVDQQLLGRGDWWPAIQVTDAPALPVILEIRDGPADARRIHPPRGTDPERTTPAQDPDSDFSEDWHRAPLVARIFVCGSSAAIDRLAEYATTRSYLTNVWTEGVLGTTDETGLHVTMPIRCARADYAYALGYMAARHLSHVWQMLEEDPRMPLPADPATHGVDWLCGRPLHERAVKCDRPLGSWLHGEPGVDLLAVLSSVKAPDLLGLAHPNAMREAVDALEMWFGCLDVVVGDRGRPPFVLRGSFPLDDLQEGFYDEKYGDHGYDPSARLRIRSHMEALAAAYGPRLKFQLEDRVGEDGYVFLGDLEIEWQIEDENMLTAVGLAALLYDWVEELLHPVRS